jgi:hypothetical protein
MVFDPATGQMLLAGGLFTIGVQVVNDVWTCSGSTWSKVTPARALPPRGGALAGYDVPTDQLLMFGGDDEGLMALDDTWLWSRFAIAEPFLPASTVGLRYPGQLDAIAGTGAVTWSVSAGSLPTGVSLTQTGALMGTPQKTGRSSLRSRRAIRQGIRPAARTW